MGMRLRHVIVALLGLGLAVPTAAQDLTPSERARIDSLAVAVLDATGAPGASIGVVRGSRIVYEQAYGRGGIDAGRPAASAMRYSIGSVSKQFTAAAVLLLQEQGLLSLDDPVSRWFPELTRAGDITLGHLLSMTSGYQDYWPHDFVFEDMKRPVDPAEIRARWARKPLDFEPGTRWQYSNTNYVIAAGVVEKVSGVPLMEFLRRRVFEPLGMTSVRDIDAGPLGRDDAQPTLRHALGPLRTAPKEAPGWLFGAGQLAMTAHDLSLWNRSVMDESLLRPESYRMQQAERRLDSGLGVGYGLGVSVGTRDGHRRISHGGAVSGYTTSNAIYPDDGVAVVVFTNIYPGTAGAASRIADGVADVLLQEATVAPADALARARGTYDGLARGDIDRSDFSPVGSAYFTQEVLADYAASLGPLGPPTRFDFQGQSLRGGLVLRSWAVEAGGVILALTTMSRPDGTYDEFVVSRVR